MESVKRPSIESEAGRLLLRRAGECRFWQKFFARAGTELGRDMAAVCEKNLDDELAARRPLQKDLF